MTARERRRIAYQLVAQVTAEALDVIGDRALARGLTSADRDDLLVEVRRIGAGLAARGKRAPRTVRPRLDDSRFALLDPPVSRR